MLHLFNKVYLEFDNKIDLNFDRVVISSNYGTPMLEQLDKVSQGSLIAYGKDLADLYNGPQSINNFADLITTVKEHGDQSDKKIIIYADNDSYIALTVLWFKTICPLMTSDAYKEFMELAVFKERAVSNTPLSTTSSLSLQSLYNGLGDISAAYGKYAVNETQTDNILDLNLNYSYELLLATYLSGDARHVDGLKKVVHLFLRRWFQELFTDNRQMCLLNLTNYRFKDVLGIDSVDITAANPLIDIDVLESYGDPEIWDLNGTTNSVYSFCKLGGLSSDKALALKNTLLNVYEKFEGMQTDRNQFRILDWINYACRDEITDSELSIILNELASHPFDTNCIPRFDFENVNFPFIQMCLDKKGHAKGTELTVYRLA